MREKPERPGNYDCCESGCCPCVWDTYSDELRAWEEEQAALKAEAEAAAEPPVEDTDNTPTPSDEQ